MLGLETVQEREREREREREKERMRDREREKEKKEREREKNKRRQKHATKAESDFFSGMESFPYMFLLCSSSGNVVN
jgi:hypothetical protein